MHMKFRKIYTVAALVFLCAFSLHTPASATVAILPAGEDTSPEITEVAAENGDYYVRYPQLMGIENTAVQTAINDEIVNEAKIAQRLITLSTLQQVGVGLQVSYTAYLEDSLLSVVISAKGILENSRNGHQYTALCYDLNTGARLKLSDFFTDPDAVAGWMEEQLLDGYVDELSTYLEYADIAPLPVGSFSFDDCGVTFYYPYKQFALLNGYSGAVQFQYGELQDFLIRSGSSVPARLGAVLPEYTDAQILENIEAAVSQGTLPYIPAALGDAIPYLITLYRLVRTPDQFPGGRYFQLEAPLFRQVLILSDALTNSYDHSVVEGILATRMNLYGLQTGTAARDQWHQVLGEPSASVYLDSSVSADYGLPVGTADYYTIADRQLMLYADENDILYAVRLAK